MKTVTKNRQLESLKVFPYIAWALTAAFAFFVYHITVELRQVADDLQTQSEFIVDQIKKNPEQIKDFTPPAKNTNSQ